MSNEANTAEICALLNRVVRALVDDPDAVDVAVVDSVRPPTVFQVRTPVGDDAAKVIGKHGQTANALRVMLMAVGAKYGETYRLDIQG